MQLNVIIILSIYLSCYKTSNYIEQTRKDSPQNTHTNVTAKADNPISDNNQIQNNTNTQINTQDTAMHDEIKATGLSKDTMQTLVDQNFHQSTAQQENPNDQLSEAVKKSQEVHENTGTIQFKDQKDNTYLTKTDQEEGDLVELLFEKHRSTDFKKKTRKSMQEAIEIVLDAQHYIVTRIILKQEHKIKPINFNCIKKNIPTSSAENLFGSTVLNYIFYLEQKQDNTTLRLSNINIEVTEPTLTEVINALTQIYSFLIKDKKTVEAIDIDYFFMFWHAFQEFFAEKKLTTTNNLNYKEELIGIKYDSSIVLYLNYVCMFCERKFVYNDSTMHISPNAHLKLFSKAVQVLVESYKQNIQHSEGVSKNSRKKEGPSRLTKSEKQDAIKFFTTCVHLRRTMYLQCMQSSSAKQLYYTCAENPLIRYFIGITALDTIMLFMNIAINYKNIITGNKCSFFTLDTALIEDNKEFNKDKINAPDSVWGKLIVTKKYAIKVENNISSAIILERTLLSFYSLSSLPVLFVYQHSITSTKS